LQSRGKKGTLILHDDIQFPETLSTATTSVSISNMNAIDSSKVLGISKKITKRKVKGIEAFPKRFDDKSAYLEAHDRKNIIGLIDKEFLRQSGSLEVKDRNLEKYLEEKTEGR